jgi:hypothetical protein
VYEHFEEHVGSMQIELNNLIVFHKRVYEHINRLECAIDANRALFAYTPIDHSSLTPSSNIAPHSSYCKREHFDKTLNLLGATLCTVLPYKYEHAAIKPICPTSLNALLANWLLRTTVHIDLVNDDALRFYRSFNEHRVYTDTSMYKSLIFRIKADTYAKMMYKRVRDKYTRMCAALTIQHAWFQYAYSPRTRLGRRRMFDTVEDLRAILP